MTHRPAFPAAPAPPGSGPAGPWAALVEGAFQWLCQSRQACHPNHPVWHFRWNWNTWKPWLPAHLRAGGPGYRLSPVPRVLTAAGERLECWEPQDAFIGRVTRGFDFLGVDFQPGAPLAPSAVSLARHTEKTARLHEQGASPERIGRYRQHWQRHLRGILGGPAAPAPTPPPPGGPTPPPAAPRAPVLSSRHPSLRPRFPRAGVKQKQ